MRRCSIRRHVFRPRHTRTAEIKTNSAFDDLLEKFGVVCQDKRVGFIQIRINNDSRVELNKDTAQALKLELSESGINCVKVLCEDVFLNEFSIDVINSLKPSHLEFRNVLLPFFGGFKLAEYGKIVRVGKVKVLDSTRSDFLRYEKVRFINSKLSLRLFKPTEPMFMLTIDSDAVVNHSKEFTHRSLLSLLSHLSNIRTLETVVYHSKEGVGLIFNQYVKKYAGQPEQVNLCLEETTDSHRPYPMLLNNKRDLSFKLKIHFSCTLQNLRFLMCHYATAGIKWKSQFAIPKTLFSGTRNLLVND